MTHTPGPWAISPTKHRTLIVSGLGFQVAAAEDLSAADAVLICAAPEMLAALESLAQAVERFAVNTEDWPELAAARAAIRAATAWV